MRAWQTIMVWRSCHSCNSGMIKGEMNGTPAQHWPRILNYAWMHLSAHTLSVNCICQHCLIELRQTALTGRRKDLFTWHMRTELKWKYNFRYIIKLWVTAVTKALLDRQWRSTPRRLGLRWEMQKLTDVCTQTHTKYTLLTVNLSLTTSFFGSLFALDEKDRKAFIKSYCTSRRRI